MAKPTKKLYRLLEVSAPSPLPGPTNLLTMDHKNITKNPIINFLNNTMPIRLTLQFQGNKAIQDLRV